ncbi:hypothetical protein [Lactococcus petauri]|uniref:hypothetical protein n=1 Tax=Lactococcus petauri TaxID=1940789 RepID=UPI00254B39F7|nr:hypothetical protein [Lactococcus petauri]
MKKSKNFQLLFLTIGLAFSFASSHIRASSISEEAFLPVQGLLIHDSLSVEESGDGDENSDISFADDVVEVKTAPNIVAYLPNTGEEENRYLFCVGLFLLFIMLLVQLKGKGRKDRI